jgi:hypothetical protein
MMMVATISPLVVDHSTCWFTAGDHDARAEYGLALRCRVNQIPAGPLSMLVRWWTNPPALTLRADVCLDGALLHRRRRPNPHSAR